MYAMAIGLICIGWILCVSAFAVDIKLLLFGAFTCFIIATSFIYVETNYKMDYPLKEKQVLIGKTYKHKGLKIEFGKRVEIYEYYYDTPRSYIFGGEDAVEVIKIRKYVNENN